MVSRNTKRLFYTIFSVPMKVSGAIYREVWAPDGESKTVKVHLGPGREKYLDGWINVDANFLTSEVDVWADLRNKLPFRDNSVDVFYSHHVIEHLPDRLLPFHFREMHRCLKPGGIFRVGGPNGHAAIKKYIEGDKKWFNDFPDNRDSIGGRLANFIFCGGEHFTILTPSYLKEIAQASGFPKIKVCKPVEETNFPDLINSKVLNMEYESTPDNPNTLIIEGKKPK